ncbi:MAG: NAD(P)H-dependent oxidoreductase [Candidatus Aminicenantales bacterium]
MNTAAIEATNRRKALLLIGSPKGKAGTSYAIGSAFFRKLADVGMETEEMTLAAALSSPENLERFGGAADAADLIVFAFPLYVDQLPAPLLRALEFIVGRRNAIGRASQSVRPSVQKVAAIIQCGFPETHQNQPAVDIMRTFAGAAGFHWAGALAMGMGGAIGKRPLEKAGGMLRNVVKALDLAAASLASGEDIPDEASTLFGKPLMAKSLYMLAGNFGMRSQAWKHGVRKRVYDGPYAS